MAEEPVAAVWSFPTDISQFDNDDRISYSRIENKHIAVQDDGTEYEFDAGLKRWIPIIDESLIAAQQAAYGAHHAVDGDDSRDSGPQGNKKRKTAPGDEDENRAGKNKKKKASRAPPPPKQNTAIYITNLPTDATGDEVAELFSRKCGVIAEEIDSGRPRVKMYSGDDGKFKGDALVVFFKPQSVQMAIMLLDDTDFRFELSGKDAGGPRMSVQAAEASYKKTNYETAADGEDGEARKADEGANGNGAPVRRSEADKQKIIKKTQKMAAKLADWSDDEYPLDPGANSKGSKWDKVVYLHRMFTLAELEEDPAALLDIKEDIREECAKLGEVTNVVLFDKEEEGIVSVKFKKAEAAEACVRMMDGRAFDGRRVEALIATGREKYRKSKKDEDDKAEDGDDE